MVQHRRAVKRARSFLGKTDLLLNFGCGEHRRDGWVNIDRHPRADLALDLREAFPFADGAVAEIYSEHFFEHLDYPKQAMGFLKESGRVLKGGGVFSLGVPDTEWPVKAYSCDESGYFDLAKEKFHPKWCDTKMHQLNFHFRQGEEHKYAYDFETLSSVLTRAGFVDIKRREFDAAQDTAARRIGTLYVVARKPE